MGKLWKSKIRKGNKSEDIQFQCKRSPESWTITSRVTGYKFSSIHVCEGFLIYTGLTGLLTRNYRKKLLRHQCCTKYEEGNGTGLGTC